MLELVLTSNIRGLVQKTKRNPQNYTYKYTKYADGSWGKIDNPNLKFYKEYFKWGYKCVNSDLSLI